MEISLGAVARVKQFCEFVPQEEDSECDTDIPDHWPASGTIQFRGVSATYRIDGSSHEVLNNVSFTIGHGKKLGLSGRTGSGKSSIIAVLLRMVDYTGSILVDGRELRTVPRDIVRSRFLSLIQDGIQFKGSVRFNVDPYDPPDIESGNRLVDQTLIEALTRVGLWAKILAGGGLEAELDDLNLSKGQIQLLAIARAMVRRDYLLPKIVLIDEATSNIDNDTDRNLQALFAEVFKHSTVIMISHRLYAFDKMHKVLMLDEGQIEDVLNRDPTSGLLVDR
ncbi:hypothetical protein K4F52_007472 [Lecanicillium sp. MT-2017a]|nr:hypothetical protein K4F52_007472 [Lecanicillium sp. MT-2017a]